MEEANFPELANSIGELGKITSPEIDKLFPEVKSHVFRELNQLAEKGHLEVDFIFDEGEVLKSGSYRIDFTAKEAEDYFQAARNFLTTPGDYQCFAEALGPELEDLVCGGKPGRYTKIKSEPWYKRRRY